MVLRVGLDAETAQKFEAIKKGLGLRNNTEVVRFLIHHRYAEIQPVEAAELGAPEVQA